MRRLPFYRHRRRGGALALALMFAALVAVAGGALLSMSGITRMNIVRQGMDVRLMVAAEAGIETVRGRFTLVAGVQDDWSGMMPTNGWNDVGGPLTINGIRVQPQAKPIGDPSVLQARVRAIATVGAKSRVVEHVIKAGNFADYSLYFGSTSTVNIGSYFKLVGNYYSKGNINLANKEGIEFFGEVDTSGKVLNYVDPAYNFKQGFNDYSPIVEIPPEAYGFDPMRSAAEDSGTLFYANTLSIELDGTDFIRTYSYRTTGTRRNYKHQEHEVRAERREIPDSSVIFVTSEPAPPGVDSWSGHSDARNRAEFNDLELWGVLDEKRVTIASEHDITITDNISYQFLLDNPELRRFANKKTDEAIADREMLGVVTGQDINFETSDWTPLPAASRVTNIPGDDGHFPNQYSLDGVFMGVNKAARGKIGPGKDRELWLCGGIINGNNPSTSLSSNFDRRNYDTDYRLGVITPPYFLRAYGKTATMVTGTWRTYEL